MESSLPKKIDRYDVIDLIGRGGMGVVYKAIDRSLNRLVAIKMVTAAENAQQDLLTRFYREAQFTANLRHPNIVTVYDLGEFAGSPYLVMEYLAGQSLDSMLAQPLTLLQKISYIRQVCNGLQYAHGRQPSIVHRDIKPANLVVVEENTIKIVDFGIARLGQSRNTRSGQLMGSYHYMSPEQITDAELDGRTDIFSAGIVLYQLLTLKLPFEGSGIVQTLNMIVHTAPPPLHDFLETYPPELDAIIDRALAKDRSERYQNASEFACDLLALEEVLKRELFSVYIERAQELLGEGDLEEARQQLSEVLKVDSQHARANELLRQVQREVARRQRKERARDLRVRADEALRQNRLASALSFLDQAVKLDESNADLQAYHGQVLELRARAEKLEEVLTRAERACASHDLDSAALAVDEALALEPTSARAKSFKSIVDAKISEREKERKVQELLASVRQKIASRQFMDALRLLQSIERLDPTVSGLRDLTVLAEAGRQQELRQNALEKAIGDIRTALDHNGPSVALSLAEAALHKFPGDPGLLNLKSSAEQQVEARKRDKAVAVIQALLSAGEFEAAEHQLAAAHRALGEFAEWQRVADQIHAEKLRSMQEEVNTALRESEDMVAFEADAKALTKLESVVPLLEAVTPDVRTRHAKLKDEIGRRLKDQEQKRHVPFSREIEEPTSEYRPPEPGERQPTSENTGRTWLSSPTTTADLHSTQPDSAVFRQTKFEDHSVAELTPLDGIALPEVPPATMTVNLAGNAGQITSLGTRYEVVSEITSTLSSPGAGALGWPADILGAIEKRLATVIGPLARVVVKKAASRAVDADQFYEMVAASIDRHGDRKAFMSHRVEMGPRLSRKDAAPDSTRPIAQQVVENAVSGEELTPAAVDRAARLLAPYAGPIAGVLAKKAARRAGSLRELYVLLAKDVEKDSERHRFLREAGFPDAA